MSDCAVRELQVSVMDGSRSVLKALQEECGLVVDKADLESRGEVSIVRHTSTVHESVVVHLYVARKWAGEVIE